jgi:hypothetical protein
MRPQWYSDNRDLAKWAALHHLAEMQEADAIVQICLLRDSVFPGIEVNGSPVALPHEVRRHFRDVTAVRRMVARPRIAVFALEFANRRDYFLRAGKFLAKARGQRTILFVDPDTGLAPRRAKAEHITKEECRELFEKLGGGDVFVLYQHRWRDREWLRKGKEQFAAALMVPVSDVGTITATRLAGDVAFFFVERTSRP